MKRFFLPLKEIEWGFFFTHSNKQYKQSNDGPLTQIRIITTSPHQLCQGLPCTFQCDARSWSMTWKNSSSPKRPKPNFCKCLASTKTKKTHGICLEPQTTIYKWLFGVPGEIPGFFISCTPPKFNSSPLKNDGWKMSFLLERELFRGELLNFGKVILEIAKRCKLPCSKSSKKSICFSISKRF